MIFGSANLPLQDLYNHNTVKLPLAGRLGSRGCLVWRSHTLSETGEGLVCVASGSCARGMFRYVTIYIAQLPGHNEYYYQYQNTIIIRTKNSTLYTTLL